ncbi:MAG: AfsR/SARP family transcriptional regulator, partial [Thermoleophilia bacterium]|nr:AfsR/SARP family transcriptional regulator [Thermoleophilia bacterium]
MEFRILGPLEVAEDGDVLALGRGRQRALLGLLLLHANEVVAQDRLVDDLWGESPPPTAFTALHGYVSRLRKLLGADRVLTSPPGYMLRLDTHELDLHRFERLVERERYREALALWRGQPLADLAFESFARSEIDRLEESRLTALEGRVEQDLAEGRHGEIVGELEALVDEHPLRERFAAQLMLALYRSGRQAEALDVYRAARSRLVEELGLEPSEILRRLERQILDHDRTLDEPRA